MDNKTVQQSSLQFPSEEKYPEKERSLLSQFKERVQDLIDKEGIHVHQELASKDWELIKWIRSGNGDLDKAESLLRASMAWRKKNGVDGAHEKTVPVGVKEILPYAFLGISPNGYGIDLNLVGRHNPIEIIQRFGSTALQEVYVGNLEYQLEQFRKQGNKSGVECRQTVSVHDYKGFTHHHIRKAMSSIVLDHFRKLSSILSENYPYHYAKTVIINAPLLYSVLFKLAKPFLSRWMADTFRVYGTNRKDWEGYLKETCGEDILPPFWGGKRQGSDQFCSEIWRQRPKDLGHFLTGVAREEEMVQIEPGQKWEKTVVVQSDAEIYWKFRTDKHEIAFGVTWKGDQTDTLKELIPFSKKESHIFDQFGFDFAPTSGEYTIVFDNSDSYFNSKKVFYNIWVE